MFKFNKLLLKLLSLLIIFISTNSYAEDEKIVQNIEELRSAGFEIKSLELENSFWYINLEKKPIYQVDGSGEIIKKNNIKFISCKYNEVKTICYVP